MLLAPFPPGYRLDDRNSAFGGSYDEAKGDHATTGRDHPHLNRILSVTQAYVFGRATGELGQSSLSPEFSRLLVSVRRNTVIGFAGGIVILALGEVLLYRSSRGNKGPSDGAPTVVS